MRKIYPIRVVVSVAVAAVVAGCAQPSVKRPTVTMDAMAKQLGVSTALLELALQAGYTTEIEGGETRFCRHDELTGSMVPVLECEDAARLRSDLQARQQVVDDLHQKVSQTAIMPTPPRPGVP